MHGHSAEEILLSTISSLPKSLIADICDSDNYRGIALTSCINKIFDWAILIRYGVHLRTSDLQFAYKANHSTTMCSLTLKEVVKYYTSKGGQVFGGLVDATKAFDPIRFDKLFKLLIDRNIPNCVIRLLIDMYTRQKVRTVWASAYSDTFSVANGVRQGGVLSTILFAVYIDVLLERLEDAGYGCYVGHEYMGALGSADDLALLAPTLYALKKMFEISEKFGKEYDVLYNADKTFCMLFNGMRQYREDPPVLFLNDSPLKWRTQGKHLGNIISWNLSEEAEIKYKKGNFIGRVNSLVANFKGTGRNVLSTVFRAQCCHFYGSQAWDLSSKYIDNFDVAWRKAVRKLWYVPNVTRSKILPHLVNMNTVHEQAASRFVKMYNNVMKVHNRKLYLLFNISVKDNVPGIVGGMLI